MKQPNEYNRTRKKQQQLPQSNPQMRNKQSNYSVSSQVSFNGDHKKQKSKSFNRHQDNTQQQQPSIVSVYRQLQYPPEIRNALKKFCYLDKQKLLKLSVNELRQLCQRELKRIDLARRNNVEVQRLLSEEEIDETDNQLSLIAITSQVNALVQVRNELTLNEGGNNEAIARTRLRQYETILLEIEKSDQLIKNFINTHLKLPQPSDISIPDCKKFFKKQAYIMSQSSDRIILSRKALCEIIIFLCRLLQGQILAFDDIYEYQDESFNSIEFGDEYNKIVVQSKTVRNNQVIVQNLDQSFSDSHSQQSKNSLNNGHHLNGNNKNGKTYQSYSNDDMGKKVKELAGICQQIPQLQAFTRTLKFSKITLQNRQSFFRIVDVIISLHHKIGYLSRNKPTLLREIEHIENDLTEVYETMRQFVVLLTSDIPQFGELRFKNEEDTKHQLTETISYLKKDMKKLAEIIREQNQSEKYLYQRLQLMRTIIQSFCQSVAQGEDSKWQQYSTKLLGKNISDEQKDIINWLSECYTTIFTELRSSQKNQQDLETEKNLQAEVHTLLTDYQRLRGEHQQLQGKYNILLEQKDELIFDIEERDKIIGNLTSIKISSQKREKSLRDQLIEAQEDAGRFEHDLGLLQEQLQIMSIQNQNKMNDLVYEHQTEVKQLVDKITMLQRAKMQFLSKYEDECSKSIKLLQDGNYSSVEMQTLRQRLQKKIRQHDDNNRRQKQLINSLQKQLQQVKNDKSLVQNKYQLAQKNKNKLMDKLQDVNNKYNNNVKNFEDKYEEEIIAIKQAHYRVEKELQKYKRNNLQLNEEIQQLKQENTQQTKTANEYRMKLIQLNSLQNEYDSLVKEYDRIVDSFHKLQANNQSLKQKLFELTSKQQEIIQLLAKQKDLTRKLQKKCKQQNSKLEDIINTYEGNYIELKEQQKINKMLQKKISQFQLQISSLQDAIHNKDKTHSITINKSQMKYQQLNGQLQQEIEKLRNSNSQLQDNNQKLLKQVKSLQKQLKQQISDNQHKEIQYQQKDNQHQQKDKQHKQKDKQHQQKDKQHQHKDKQWSITKSQQQKKLSQNQQQILSLQQKIKQLQEQCYNQSIFMQQIKQQKNIYELRITQIEGSEKEQITQLKKSIQAMQLNQNKLKHKITKLQSQVERLCGEIQQLKLIIRQKDNQLQENSQQLSKKLRQKQSQQHQRQQQQYLTKKNEQIIQLREHILVQKNLIITQNTKLHQQNNQLQQQIAKLKLLNDLLEKNVNKLQNTSTQAKQQFITDQNSYKLTVNKHLFTISSLQYELTSINNERENLRKYYQDLQHKLQAKCKLLADKDNLLFERQLQKNNLQKVVKQLKFKISQFQTTIQGLNNTIEKLKNNKIKTLQQEVTQLNGLLQQSKKKQQLSRSTLNDLQQQLQKLKRDNTKRIDSLKQQHSQLQQQYQSQIKKIQSQHVLDLSSLQHKTRKDTQNQFNQLLIKEKQTFNNLTIQKMEQLGQMQRKYQKLIREQRNQKNSLQQECNRLERELNDHKRNKSLNESRILQEQTDNTLEQLKKLKSQYQLLKRQHTRLQQQNNRLTTQSTINRQQNTTLLAKSLQSQHSITILTSRLNLMTQNLQTTKKSIQQIHKVLIQKLNLQRDLQKLKTKGANDETKINDYKNRIQQMDLKINDLQQKLQLWRNKQFEWTRTSNQSTQRFRALNSQSSDMSLKLQQMKQKLLEMTNKLTEKAQKLQTIQTQLQLTEQRVRQKQIQLTSTKQHLQSEIVMLQEQLYKKVSTNTMLQKEKRQMIIQWEQKQQQLREENQLKARKVRELEMQLNEYKRNLSEGSKVIDELTKVRGQKMQLQDKCNRIQVEMTKYKSQKLILQKENDLLKKQLIQMNNQRSKLSLQILDLQHQLTLLQTHNQQLSIKTQQLTLQLNQEKQFFETQLKSNKDKLLNEFQVQRKMIQSQYQDIVNQLNSQMTKQRQKNNQLITKYNKLLQEIQQQQKMIDTLRKQNMRLSDHCQKYQERIRVLQQQINLLEQQTNALQNDHKLKGLSTQQIQNKYHSTQSQLNQLKENNNYLTGELQKVNTQSLSYKKRINQLERQLQNLLKDKKQRQNKLKQTLADNQRKNNDLNNLQYRINLSLNQLQTIKNQNTQLHQTLTQTNTQNQHLQQTITSYHQSTHGSNQQLQHLRAQNIRLQNILSQKTNQLQATTKQLQTHKLTTNNSEQTLIQTQKDLQWMRSENNLLVDKINDMQKQLELLANDFSIVQQRLHQAETYIIWSDNQRKQLEDKLSILIHDLQRIILQKQQFQQRLLSTLKQLQRYQIQTKTLKVKILQTQAEKNQKKYQTINLITQNQTLSKKLSELQAHLKQLENQHKLTELQKSTQQSTQIHKLKAELALTRQQLLRLNDVIKRKQEDFEREITRLTYEKSTMWKQTQLLIQQYQSLKIRSDQAQRLNELKERQLQDLKHQRTKILNEIEELRKQLAIKSRQLVHNIQQLSEAQKKEQQLQRLLAELQRKEQDLLRVLGEFERKQQQLNRALLQSQIKQQQLTRTLINQQNEMRRISMQNEGIKNRLSIYSQQDEQIKLSESRLKEHSDSLSGEVARLQSELAVMRMEYSRLHGEHNKITLQNNRLNDQLHHTTQQYKRLNSQLRKQHQQTQHFIKQCQQKDHTIIQITKQLQTLSHQSSTTHVISSINKQDLDKANQQMINFRSIISRLQMQNQNLSNHLTAKDKIITEMKDNVNKGNQLMENADKELKKTFEQRNRQAEIIRNLTHEKDNLIQNLKHITYERDSYLQIIRMRESQTTTLKETITLLERRITQLTSQIHHLNQTNQHQLTQSRSNINLVTKSYSYQGGQVTSAQLTRLQQENRRLIKEIQSRDNTINRHQLEIQRLTKEIKILKEQIHLLSQGKTINIKGYTRVTNPNDNTLNKKGTIYTEYDVKEMKAKIQSLEKSLARYQDRETQLLREIEKYKFRERHYIEQIRMLEENAQSHKQKQPDSFKQISVTNSPQKKTAFDQEYNNRENQPQSSTYRIQTGIEVTQRSTNMTKKQVKTTEKYFMRVEGQELRRIIERLTSGQQITSSKIDEILNTAQRMNKQSLQLVLNNNQFNLTPLIINQIRQLIHQNKALVETLKSMKQFKQDVGLLIQEYLDPQLLTQFVYRILTYFSQVSDQSSDAKEIRNELNMIRKNNVGGFYFTVLEEYTKYILENNSIEIYKEELRQKARELISFREKFQSIIDSKLDQNDKLLNRSDSKNSFLNRSRTKYMGSSRVGSSRGKSESSEISKDDNSRIIQIVPSSSNSGNGNRMSLPKGQTNVLPNPINLLTGGGGNVYNLNQQNYSPSNLLSPMLITADRPRTSSTITYTPYNKQMAQTSTPTQSVNESRVHVSYSATSTSHMANSHTNVNSSNTVNLIKYGFEKKL